MLLIKATSPFIVCTPKSHSASCLPARVQPSLFLHCNNQRTAHFSRISFQVIIPVFSLFKPILAPSRSPVIYKVAVWLIVGDAKHMAERISHRLFKQLHLGFCKRSREYSTYIYCAVVGALMMPY